MNRHLALATLSSLLLLNAPRALAGSAFRETDLVSDIVGRAAHDDAKLVNPWGIVAGPHGELRVADNGSGVSTVYSANGTSGSPLIIVPPAEAGNPTGMVSNTSESAFIVSSGEKSGRSSIIFASEDGSISAWSAEVDPDHAIRVASTENAVYKGIALGHNESGAFLVAGNFHAGTVDVFNGHFAPVSWAGAFTDPELPEGYAPFNIANLLGSLYVTYAKQNEAKHDDVRGAGHGFLDVFDEQGHLVRRLVSQGPLNSPWGMVLAPRRFGPFGRDLLVGNFGDGTINAFDPNTGQVVGHLEGSPGTPIAIDNLWGLTFGRGSDRGESKGEDASDAEGSPTLYFTAGIEDEGHGLFGSLQPLDQESDQKDKRPGIGHGDGGDGELTVSTAGANPVHLARAGGVEFRLSTVAPVTVRLRVYDASGRLVAEPVRDLPVAGTVVARWDGFDLGGAKVQPGTYFYHAVAGNRMVRGRLILLR